MSGNPVPTKRSDMVRDGAPRVRPAHDAHIRVTGTIRIGPRYALLEDDDGDVWRLRSEDELGAFGDQRVIVEARVNATDELIVLWVGPEAASGAG